MPFPEEIIQEYEDKFINGLELLEGLARFDRWVVEIERLEQGGYVPKIYEDFEKKIFLNLFSKLEYLEYYLKESQKPLDDLFIEAKGHWIFQNLPKGIELLCIDRERDHNINYKKEQLELVEEMGKAVELDEPFLRISHFSGESSRYGAEFSRIYRYAGYYIIQKGNLTPLAPDKEGRKLFPIFTTKYAANRYVHVLKEEEPKSEFISKAVSGKELFAFLKKTQIDGFVVNCIGPNTPRAFHKILLDWIVPK